MLPLSPPDCSELSFQEESAMATDLAEAIATYCYDELMGKFTELAEDILKEHDIDPATAFGYDLINDLLRRVKITAK